MKIIDYLKTKNTVEITNFIFYISKKLSIKSNLYSKQGFVEFLNIDMDKNIDIFISSIKTAYIDVRGFDVEKVNNVIFDKNDLYELILYNRSPFEIIHLNYFTLKYFGKE